jgi:hypothetical protein
MAKAPIFRPLTGAPSLRRVTPILIEVQGADAIGIKTSEDGRVHFTGTFALVRPGELAIEKQGFVNPDCTSRVREPAAPEDGICVIRAVIEDNRLVLDVSVSPLHGFSTPVVVRTNTVAETGEAASFPGRGLE